MKEYIMSQKKVTLINIAPVPKPRMTQADRWKKRPATTRYWNFKDDLKKLVAGQLEPVFEVTFHVPMPKSWSEKEKVRMCGMPHQQKPDVDNYLKALMDALCEDDSYIYDAHPRKYWARVGSIELIEMVPGNFSEAIRRYERIAERMM